VTLTKGIPVAAPALVGKIKRSSVAIDDGPCGRPIPIDDDALLHESEAAYIYNVSVRTLQGWRIKGGGPRFIKLGGPRGPVRYRRRELREHAERNMRRSTSDAGDAFRIGIIR